MLLIFVETDERGKESYCAGREIEDVVGESLREVQKSWGRNWARGGTRGLRCCVNSALGFEELTSG